jgi:type III secretory pathway component EscR
MMIMALAMFLTFFVMEPVFTDAWDSGISPYMDGVLTEEQAWVMTTDPFRTFMTNRTEPETLFVLSDALNRPLAEGEAPSFPLLATGFMLSEVKHAFPDRLRHLPAVHGDRPRGGLRADGGWHDDGAAHRGFIAVQARIFCSGRRLA